MMGTFILSFSFRHFDFCFIPLLLIRILPGTESSELPSRLIDVRDELQLRDLLNKGVLAAGTVLIATQDKGTVIVYALK